MILFIAPRPLFISFHNADYDILVYSITEIAMILICSSLPLLPKFLQLIIPSTTRSKPTSSPSAYQQPLKGHSAKSSNIRYNHSKSNNLSGLPVCNFSHTGIDTLREGSEDSYLPLTNKGKLGIGMRVTGGSNKDVDVDVEKLAGEKAILKTVRLEQD